MESKGRKNLNDILSKKEVILLDIEGTTTSIDFVKDVLFPEARKHVEEYLLNYYEDEPIKQIIEDLLKEIRSDVNNRMKGVTLPPKVGCPKSVLVSALVKNILAMMDADRKVKPLKALQGHIWKKGYENGDIKGHVYDDVVTSLPRWQEEGKRICIYSSGSIDAQKLLFTHSIHGNLVRYFSDHFDTAVGSKLEKESYQKIAQTLKVDAEAVLFVTDREKEAIAASAAGMDVVLSVRPGNQELSEEALLKFPTIHSFTEFFASDSATEENSCSALKRRKISAADEDVGNETSISPSV